MYTIFQLMLKTIFGSQRITALCVLVHSPIPSHNFFHPLFLRVSRIVWPIFLTPKNGDIWLATISGLVQLVDQGERAILYQSDDTNVNSLAVNELLSLMIDKSGLLWIGTRGGGIDKLNLKRKAFEHYKVNVNSEIGLSSEMYDQFVPTQKAIYLLATRTWGLM